jgi:hypothetical protein
MKMRHTNRISLALCLALVVIATACNRAKTTDTSGTTGTAVKVTDVTLGRAIGSDKTITDRTENFRPNDTIYASIATEGTAASSTLRARWTYQDGQVVDESTRTIAPNNRERTEFHIAKPNGWPNGNYQLEVFLDDRSVEKKAFEVKGS